MILVTGASSGFGAMTVRALADAIHVVYAGMRDIRGRNAQAAAAARRYADKRGATLRPIEMDVSDQASVDGAVAAVLAEARRIDVVIHNAGHMVLGPTEAFTPEQVAAVYDTNVLSTQRVNRAVLPSMREQRDGLDPRVGRQLRGADRRLVRGQEAGRTGASRTSRCGGLRLRAHPVGIETSRRPAVQPGTNHFANAALRGPSDVRIRVRGADGDELANWRGRVPGAGRS